MMYTLFSVDPKSTGKAFNWLNLYSTTPVSETTPVHASPESLRLCCGDFPRTAVAGTWLRSHRSSTR